MGATTQFVRSSDGTRIAYDRQGNGPALLLLHPYPRSRQLWHQVGYPQRLRNQFTVITIDLRGLGESATPTTPAGYAIDRYIADVHAVADACGVERFLVWGHSLGGAITTQLTVASSRVIAAVVAGNTYGNGNQTWARDEQIPYIERLIQAKRTDALDMLPADDQTYATQTDLDRELAFWQMFSSWPVVDAQDAHCQVMLYVGSNDHPMVLNWFREHQAELERLHMLPRIFEGLTHLQELTAIEAVLPPVLAFLYNHQDPA